MKKIIMLCVFGLFATTQIFSQTGNRSRMTDTDSSGGTQKTSGEPTESSLKKTKSTKEKTTIEEQKMEESPSKPSTETMDTESSPTLESEENP
jgi:hypothetical protein